MKTRLVVLISGNGSNLQAIIDACQQDQLNAEVAAVFANKSTAYGLQRAAEAGIASHVLIPRAEQPRHLYDAELADAVASYKPDWIILAGWMRILSMAFLSRFAGRVINLHPALPGQFPGVNAIERAWQAYQEGILKHTGIMVHLVPDEGVDVGPVLAQVDVPIHASDDLTSFAERMHQQEHQLLITTLAKICKGD